MNQFKKGDRVAVVGISNPTALVKEVSHGGTVVLKSAINGRRCFEAHELEGVCDECGQTIHECDCGRYERGC